MTDELRKHTLPMMQRACTELGWVSIPLMVEPYGAWGKEAQQCFSRLTSCLAVHGSVPKSMATLKLLCKAKHLPDEGDL